MSIDPAYAAQVMHDILVGLAGNGIPNTTGGGATTSSGQDSVLGSLGSGSSGASTPYTGGTGGPVNVTGNRNQDGFYVALLQRLGMPVSQGNIMFMRAWNQAEGMDAGYHNPFATTEGAPGASSINSVGVKAYGSLEEGVDATARTLRNGLYQGILDGLSRSDPWAAAQGVASSPWGTGSLVLRVLGSNPGGGDMGAPFAAAPDNPVILTAALPENQTPGELASQQIPDLTFGGSYGL